MIALMLVGVSYAMWSKTLYIDGTVNTGTVNAIWTKATNLDGTGELDPKPDGTRRDKDVGETIVTGLETQTLVVTVNNAYPCYYNDLQVEFTYIGTVPARIQEINIIPDGWTVASAYGADDGPIWIELVNGIGAQLHEGDKSASSFTFHVEQCAEQGHTYTFTVEIVLVQWNEYTQGE